MQRIGFIAYPNFQVLSLCTSRAKQVLAAVTACEGPLYEGSDKHPRKFAAMLALPAAYVQLREELTKLRNKLFNVALFRHT
jgi:hypothetical protein